MAEIKYDGVSLNLDVINNMSEQQFVNDAQLSALFGHKGSAYMRSVYKAIIDSPEEEKETQQTTTIHEGGQ